MVYPRLTNLEPPSPIRPIVSLRGTPKFGLAKWLFQRLKFLTQGSETTNHSAERFIEKLQDIRRDTLFTSIPQHLAIGTVKTLLEQHYDETGNKLKIKHLIDLLKHCLKIFFAFNGATYEQVKGTLMGSPLSSLIAEAVLQRLEALAFDHYRPRLRVRESLFTPPDYDIDEGPKIESVSFDEATVRKELMTLNESKSPGPDDIPPKLLKELAAELAKPLSMLFQASFEAGCLPADWKSARITPLHKGGSKASANNYRPISLTSICCKLMEKIIKRELMRFLEQHNLLSDAQHGFRSGRSCVTNLLNCLERWTRSVDEGNALHVVYIDFKKAFDSVPHQRLLHKLSRIGVRGNLLKSIQSFLLDRTQTVYVGGQQSMEVAVESGVPQGSVLGPTLFIIYINDCVREMDCGVAMFADDIKLWSIIRTADDEEHLQANLNRLQQWSKDWLLPFNEKKCNILRVGRARSPNHMAYCLNGIPLQEVDSQKDWGVWITTSLKPSLHCTKIAKSAMSVLYLVKRTFSAFDEDCFAKVFRTFVRPQLEFAIQAWRP
ncbi:hypothetical protein SprV_0902666300 [Sparganum proliferum]